MAKINNITCHKLVNSRGSWTIQAHMELDDGSIGVQAIPEGASKGENEAVYLPVNKAVDVVSSILNELLHGVDIFDQEKIDSLMLEKDGTENKAHLGGNSILAVSLASSKAAAVSLDIPLYKYLAKLYGNKNLYENNNLVFPTPVFNILNGGKHAQNGLSFQEFMVIPVGGNDFEKQYEIGVDIYSNLKEKLINDGHDVGVGDEGGFAPKNFDTTKALEYIKEAVGDYIVGEEVFFGSDVAAESFWEVDKYNIKEEGRILSSDELLEYYINLLKNFEIIYLEDPFYEGDRNGWKNFYQKLGSKVMVVADDLVVTNPKFLKSAIQEKMANAVIVKPNQVGTLTETLEFVRMAQKAGMSIIVSHRSGDVSEDTFIADLSLGVGAEFIKSGAPARGERVAKYNRLLEIFYNTNLNK